MSNASLLAAVILVLVTALAVISCCYYRDALNRITSCDRLRNEALENFYVMVFLFSTSLISVILRWA